MFIPPQKAAFSGCRYY